MPPQPPPLTIWFLPVVPMGAPSRNGRVVELDVALPTEVGAEPVKRREFLERTGEPLVVRGHLDAVRTAHAQRQNGVTPGVEENRDLAPIEPHGPGADHIDG